MAIDMILYYILNDILKIILRANINYKFLNFLYILIIFSLIQVHCLNILSF